MKSDIIIFFREKMNYTEEEINKLTMLQVQLFVQRYNEPFFAEQLNREIHRIKEKANG